MSSGPQLHVVKRYDRPPQTGNATNNQDISTFRIPTMSRQSNRNRSRLGKATTLTRHCETRSAYMEFIDPAD